MVLLSCLLASATWSPKLQTTVSIPLCADLMTTSDFARNVGLDWIAINDLTATEKAIIIIFQGSARAHKFNVEEEGKHRMLV